MGDVERAFSTPPAGGDGETRAVGAYDVTKFAEMRRPEAEEDRHVAAELALVLRVRRVLGHLAFCRRFCRPPVCGDAGAADEVLFWDGDSVGSGDVIIAVRLPVG